MLSTISMEEKQLNHNQIDFKTSSKIKIDIFLDEIYSPANLGSIFRNAEAFDVENIYLSEFNKKDLDSNRFKRTSRSTERELNTIYYENFNTVFEEYRGSKIGLEITTNSKNVTEIKEHSLDRILLVLGNERYGIREHLLKELDQVYHIKMFGTNSSLNVSQTLGIALHEIRR